MDLQQQLRKARGRAVPLIAVATPDQPAVARNVASWLVDSIVVDEAGTRRTPPVIGWDSARGPHPINREGEIAVEEILGALGGMQATETTFIDVAVACYYVTIEDLVVVAHNAHRLLRSDDPQATRSIQAIANLRDAFKDRGASFIALCPSWPAPIELGSDVLVLDDTLPSDAERSVLISEIVQGAREKGAQIDDAAIERATRATCGLAPFAVEQAVSLSIERDGLDDAALRQRFISAINATPGLTYSPDRLTADDIAGSENVKAFANALAGSRRKPRAIVMIDEIEKHVAGGAGPSADTSGASQAILGNLLTWMQEENATGLIAMGPPGTGKSLFSKILGAICGAPTIFFDLSGTKGQYVGQTEAQIKGALRTIKEMTGGDVFIVASCNSEAALPPELRRRFKNGIWFFDLPTADEREAIWQLYFSKYGLDASQERPDDEGWTGAEIASCCESAWSFNIPIAQAAQWIVPVAKSAAEQIQRLRETASGRYISASAPGAYVYRKVEAKAPSGGARRFNFDA